MWCVKGTVLSLNSEDIHWTHYDGSEHGHPEWEKSDEEGVKVSFDCMHPSNPYLRRPTIKAIERILEKNNVPWIAPGYKEWTFDLDKLKKFIPEFSSMGWFKGKVSIDPEFETFKNGKRSVFYDTRAIDIPQYKATVDFYIIPEVLRSVMNSEPQVEIQESLNSFKLDHPDPTKVAFIMMQFGKTKAHDKIVKAIKNVLKSHDLTGVKADDKQYHDDLFPNVMTYLYGCGFGIAVFERIEDEEFNPNVSLEVGYMFALRKPVCLLKDETLKRLHTDLIGKLYEDFDPQDPVETISSRISKWLSDKGIV